MRLGMPTRPAKLAVAVLVASGALSVGAGAASAVEVVYDNRNTVPTVGAATEDTFSEAFVATGSTSIGGLVEFGGTQRKLTSVTAEVDSFRCQEGTYNGSCRSGRGKKFPYTMTVKVYEMTGAFERGALIAEKTATAKLPYRPTTNASCPDTVEGKGFGANCDVGGVLAHIKFKHFSKVLLPSMAIIELTTSTPDDDVNVGLEGAYKEYDEATEEFVGLPGSGAPAVGSNPLSEDVFLDGVASSGFAGYQPVFEVIAKEGRSL